MQDGGLLRGGSFKLKGLHFQEVFVGHLLGASPGGKEESLLPKLSVTQSGTGQIQENKPNYVQ